jgi:tetratricopeptide (TPR) repeat protein
VVHVGAEAWIAWSAFATAAALPAWKNDVAMYDAMVKTQPGNATGPLGQALIALDQGRDREALAALARAERLDPLRFEVPLYAGRIALGQGRYADAESLARRAQTLGGWNRDAALLRVLALQQLGRWSASRPVIDSLLTREAEDADVRWASAAQLAGERRHADAVAAYRRLLEVSPGDYDGWLALAASSAAAGDPASALAALDHAGALPQAADGRAAAARASLLSPARPPALAPPGTR